MLDELMHHQLMIGLNDILEYLLQMLLLQFVMIIDFDVELCRRWTGFMTKGKTILQHIRALAKPQRKHKNCSKKTTNLNAVLK